MRAIAAVGFLLVSCTCFAGEDASKSPNQTDQRDKVVCEKEKALDSNRIVRVCMTESQRAQAREEARGDLQRLGSCSGNENACVGSL